MRLDSQVPGRRRQEFPHAVRVIYAPEVIVARARADTLIMRALESEPAALQVIAELEAEVADIDIPARFSRTSLVGDVTQAEHKRRALLMDLDQLKTTFTEAFASNNMAKAVHTLQMIIMDIESTKAEDSAEAADTSEVFSLQGVDIKLQKIGLVFNPSPHGLFLGEHIRIEPGESVIDVGTGSGLFAIMAARLGGKVSATEISQEAVSMTRLNAFLNDVSVAVLHGSFFARFQGNFDVLVANLPQKLILDKDDSPKPDAKLLGVRGGTAGNEILLAFLNEAKEHMAPDSRLYIQVYSLTDHAATMKEISKYYRAKPLARKEFIEDDLIQANVAGYEQLKEQGVVDISFHDGHWYAYETAYELQLLDKPQAI